MSAVYHASPRRFNNNRHIIAHLVQYEGLRKNDTHLKIGQNHFSIHVAIAAFGGHGNDWLKAVLVPLALAAFCTHTGTLSAGKTVCLGVAASERAVKLGNVELSLIFSCFK